MGDAQQGRVVDASLVSLRRLEDDMRARHGSPKTSHHQLGSLDSGSSGTAVESPNVSAGRKRKRADATGSSGDEASKRRSKGVSARHDRFVFVSELPPRRDVSRQLPAGVWHHIFSLLPPRALGVLLRVSRLFHNYLDPASPFKVSAPAFQVPSLLPALSPDAIWRASRCLFWPKMPTPLRGKSELDMWRFACSRSCQICGLLDENDSAWDSLPWSRGPGNNIVSPIFSFFTNSCGNCLASNSIKEVDVLLSASVPSFILPGLPMVFLTTDVNAVSAQAVRSTPVPASVQLTKVYWPAQVESFQAELEDVKRLGLAATEEWIKGLEIRGAETIHDASRWERWYLSGGVRQMLMHSSSIPPMPTTHRGPGSDMQNVGGMAVRNGIAATRFPPSLPLHPRRNPKRQTREAVEELKSRRRADIEARAARLRPPIPPNVLNRLAPFQAAMQINRPLDNREWKLLKPRLLNHRQKMDQTEKKCAASTRALLQHQGGDEGKETMEVAHQRRYDDPETLLRIHISTLADRVIRDCWRDGKSIKKTNCAHFATEVLAYVRKQFYAESSNTSAASLTRRLTLDDMRWVFDNKIGPHTNRHWKEFFFCNGCPNSKLYGFHAVVQHYAAKHATKKQRDVFLHWRGEWPEEPLFRSSPMLQAPNFSSTARRVPDAESVVDSYQSRVDTVANILESIWQVLKNSQYMPTAVKIHVLIHHIAKGYQEQYREPALLEMFLDCLDLHKSFSAVSGSQGLACKLCMSSQKQDKDRQKVFSLFTLASHFYDMHLKERTLQADWRVDMVWLPDMHELQGLQAHIRQDERAFELTSDALPWLFGSEEETSQDGLVPSRPWRSSVAARFEEVDTASTPPVTHHRYQDERYPPDGDVPSLLPASTVYAELAMIPEKPRHRADDVSRTQSMGDARNFDDCYEPLDSMREQYKIGGPPDMGSDPSWGSAHTDPRTVRSRDVVPELRSHLSTFHLHHEQQPYVAERPGDYPYYPDMESQRERGHAEAGARYTNHSRYHIPSGYHIPSRGMPSRYHISSGYQQPASSAPLYRYVESFPSYDRYDIVDARGMPNEHYVGYPAILREYRIPSNADRSSYTGWEPRSNAAPASRVYDTYASQYTLTNSRSENFKYDAE